MYKKKKPLRDGSGTHEVMENSTTQKEYTTSQSETQGPVAKILWSSRALSEGAKMSDETILEALGMSQDKDARRHLQKMIREERLQSPIVTGGKGRGYWLADPSTPQGRADIARCAATYARRGGNTMVTVHRLRRFLGVMPGQMGIDGSEV